MGKWGVDHDPLREMDMNWIEDENIQRMSRTNDRLLLRYGKGWDMPYLRQESVVNPSHNEKGQLAFVVM